MKWSRAQNRTLLTGYMCVMREQTVLLVPAAAIQHWSVDLGSLVLGMPQDKTFSDGTQFRRAALVHYTRV